MGLYAIREKGVRRREYVVGELSPTQVEIGGLASAKKSTNKGEAEAYSERVGLSPEHYEVVPVTPAEMAEAELRAKAEWAAERGAR